MSDQTRILTKQDIEVINANFDLNLEYQNAEHYRAAQVIRNLWKNAPVETDAKGQPLIANSQPPSMEE